MRITGLAKTWRRGYSTAAKSPHAAVYTHTLPAMIPVFLLGSAVYIGLQLTQLNLSHEQYMGESAHKIEALEAEIEALRQQKSETPENTIHKQQSTQQPPTSSRWRFW